MQKKSYTRLMFSDDLDLPKYLEQATTTDLREICRNAFIRSAQKRANGNKMVITVGELKATRNRLTPISVNSSIPTTEWVFYDEEGKWAEVSTVKGIGAKTDPKIIERLAMCEVRGQRPTEFDKSGETTVNALERQNLIRTITSLQIPTY